jgi:molybdate transport system substrate-binding protein
MENLVTGVIGRLFAIATFFLAPAALANAAEINVYSTIAMRGALEQLVPQFQKQSGQTIALTWGTAALLTRRIAAGEPADVAILTRANIDALAKDGKIAPGSDATLASSGIAIAIKAGAPKPDISTPEALKQTLLDAKSVAYSDPSAGGASGVYFATLLDKLGIADAMKAKTRHPSAGGNSARLVASGEAALAVQQKSEIMSVTGVDIVGLLPGDLNKITEFAAGVTAGSKSPDAGKALIKFLQSPDALKVFEASGFGPS